MRSKMYLLTFMLVIVIGIEEIYGQLRFDYPVVVIENTSLKVVYSLKYQEDSTNPYFIRNIDMYLFLGKNTSYFVSENKYISDTMLQNVKNIAEFQQMLDNPNLPIARVRYKIYKNYPKGKITYIEHIPSTTFRYEEPLNLFDWKLTGEMDTIKNYVVKKATCKFGGRSWTAWFTPEIPYSDGPYKFCGLPGLILKIYDNKKHYVFEMEYLEKPNKNIPIKLVEKDFLFTTKSKFFKAKEAFRDDLINRAQEAGFNNKESQTIYLKFKSRNNPIELDM